QRTQSHSNRFLTPCFHGVNQQFFERSPRFDLVGYGHVFFKGIFVAKHIKVLRSRSADEEPHEITHQAMFAHETESTMPTVVRWENGAKRCLNHFVGPIEARPPPSGDQENNDDAPISAMNRW